MDEIKTKITNLFSLKVLLNKQMKSSNLICLKQEEIRTLQNALLAMYRDIVAVCEQYDIKPILQGGTLLGKVRHEGFIPWDDDLDIGMARNDYEKFKTIFQKELSEKYILTAPNSQYPAVARFIQIFKKESYYESFAHRKNVPKMLYIDVFPIDYVPNFRIFRFFKGYYSNFLMLLAGCAEYKQNIEPHVKELGNTAFTVKINLFVHSFLGGIASIKSLSKWYDSIDSAINYSKVSDICTSGTGRKHYIGECVAKDVFFPLKETTFYGAKAWMPNKSDEYLKNLYGNNYMQIPSEEKRENHFIKGFKV